MYNQLIATILFGVYKPDQEPYEAIPTSTEEQYTILSHLNKNPCITF
ncbi:unnamed protein product [Gongylonema pulchrum]|uniref:Myosin motor domain-containing protein n=1 Tax=Gongylonema pulchrum TaxID=637853 RepID=A0A183ECX2_9BILA|nr:unnamed protein product [Gongylonema pulchrum]